MSDNRRLQMIAGHLAHPKEVVATPQNCAGSSEDPDSKTPGKQDAVKWNGWGYRDSRFELKDGQAQFTGSRYILGGQTFPKLLDWFVNKCHADISHSSPSKPLPDPSSLPSAQINEPFLTCIRKSGMQHTLDPHLRLFHGHGHTCHEIFELRHGSLHRIPDIVIWPNCHKDVEEIVRLAVEHNVCIIPFGGGTSVSNALECPDTEKRMIVSLDMTKMKKILWVDEENLVAHIEAGIIGQELEQQVRFKVLRRVEESDVTKKLILFYIFAGSHFSCCLFLVILWPFSTHLKPNFHVLCLQQCSTKPFLVKSSYDSCSYECKFSNYVEKPEKFRASMAFQPITPRCRCDTLTNWVMKS